MWSHVVCVSCKMYLLLQMRKPLLRNNIQSSIHWKEEQTSLQLSFITGTLSTHFSSFVIDNVTCNYCPFPGTGCQSLRSKKPVPVRLYPCQQGRVSTHWFLPGYLLHVTNSSGVMPDFSYDKGDEGITGKAGWLKQFSFFSLLISIIAASKIFRNFWARLLENCWDCFVLFSNMLYQPMEEDGTVVAVFHQGMPHCQWRKRVWCHLKYIVQINGQGSALPNTTAVILFLSLHSWFK